MSGPLGSWAIGHREMTLVVLLRSADAHDVRGEPGSDAVAPAIRKQRHVVLVVGTFRLMLNTQ